MDWPTNTIFRPFQQIFYNAARWLRDKRDSGQFTRGIHDFANGPAMMETEPSKNSGIGDIIADLFVCYCHGIAVARQKKFVKVEDWRRRLQIRLACRRYIMTPIT